MRKQCFALSMIQIAPLPGSFCNKGEKLDTIIDKSLEEARILSECGFDGAILQNMGDMPIRQQSSPESIAYITVIASAIKSNFPSLGLGILINWDGMASLAVAEAVNADFVRVEHVYTGIEITSAGLLQGQCCEITALKKKLGSNMPIYADIYEPHGIPLGAKPIEDAAWESVNEAFADGLFICGKSMDESIDMVKKARSRVPDTQIILGGGATGDNIYNALQYFDGACVATWIKNGSLRNPIDKSRAKKFSEEVARARYDKNNL